MYLQEETFYFSVSLIFTILPLVVSILLVIVWIRRWLVESYSVSRRIKTYIAKYSFLLIIFTIIGDFYSCIILLQSKLLCMEMFNFPLKKNESDRLVLWKFINVTLLEVESLHAILSYTKTKTRNFWKMCLRRIATICKQPHVL